MSRKQLRLLLHLFGDSSLPCQWMVCSNTFLDFVRKIAPQIMGKVGIYDFKFVEVKG